MNLPALLAMQHTPHKRNRVQIADSADAYAGWILFQPLF